MRLSNWGIMAIFSAVAAMILVGMGVARLTSARREFVDTLGRRDRLVQDVSKYFEYSALQADTLFQTQPKADFEQRVASVIRGSEVRPTPRYTVGVLPDQEHRDSQGRSTGLRSQRASVQVAGLTPAQAGSILALWFQDQQIWTPVSISLVHNARSREGGYTLNMECLAVYHSQGRER